MVEVQKTIFGEKAFEVIEKKKNIKVEKIKKDDPDYKDDDYRDDFKDNFGIVEAE